MTNVDYEVNHQRKQEKHRVKDEYMRNATLKEHVVFVM